MLPIILYAIASASRPDSTVPLTPEYVHHVKPNPPPYRKPIVRKKVRQWRGIFEHKDTPLHKS
jgi:hypothetical protein